MHTHLLMKKSTLYPRGRSAGHEEGWDWLRTSNKASWTECYSRASCQSRRPRTKLREGQDGGDRTRAPQCPVRGLGRSQERAVPSLPAVYSGQMSAWVNVPRSRTCEPWGSQVTHFRECSIIFVILSITQFKKSFTWERFRWIVRAQVHIS